MACERGPGRAKIVKLGGKRSKRRKKPKKRELKEPTLGGGRGQNMEKRGKEDWRQTKINNEGKGASKKNV